MHFNPYGGPAAELAAALVNLPPTAPAAAVARAMAEHDNLRRPPTAAQARELLRWARRLEAVFGEPDLGRQVEVANDLLRRSVSRPHISCHDGRAPHLHYAPADGDTAVGVRAFTAAGVALVVCEDGDRLGRCGRDGCSVVYVDTSRNGRRRFCSTRCANRVYVADHRRRAEGRGRPARTAGQR